MNATDDHQLGHESAPATVKTIEHDWHGDTSLSVAILETILEFPGVTPEDVPPLYACVDPDGLDALFAPTNRSGDRPDGRLWITVGDFDVTISADGTVVVQRRAP